MSVIPSHITHVTFIKDSNTDSKDRRSSGIFRYLKNAINISEKERSQTAVIFDIDAEAINRTVHPLTFYIIFNVLKYTRIVFSNSDQCYETEPPQINIFPLTSMFETGFIEIFEPCSDSLMQLLKTIPGSSTSLCLIFSALIRAAFYNLCGDFQSQSSSDETLDQYVGTSELSDNANEDEWLPDSETISIYKNLLEDWFCADNELLQPTVRAFKLKNKMKQSIVNIEIHNTYACNSKLASILFTEYKRLGLDTLGDSEVIFAKNNSIIPINIVKSDCFMKSCKLEVFNTKSEVSNINFIHPENKVHCKNKRVECIYTNLFNLCDRKSQTLMLCIPCKFLRIFIFSKLANKSFQFDNLFVQIKSDCGVF